MVFCTDGGMLYSGYVFNGYLYNGIEYHYSHCPDGIGYDYAISCKKRKREKFGKIINERIKLKPCTKKYLRK